MQITSCIRPGDQSPARHLFEMLAANPALAQKGVRFTTLVIHAQADIAKIPNAQARAEATQQGLAYFPIVLVDGQIQARGRLLTAAEYERLIDGLSIQTD